MSFTYERNDTGSYLGRLIFTMCFLWVLGAIAITIWNQIFVRLFFRKILLPLPYNLNGLTIGFLMVFAVLLPFCGFSAGIREGYPPVLVIIGTVVVTFPVLVFLWVFIKRETVNRVNQQIARYNELVRQGVIVPPRNEAEYQPTDV
jgi:predicted membrane protein